MEVGWHLQFQKFHFRHSDRGMNLGSSMNRPACIQIDIYMNVLITIYIYTSWCCLPGCKPLVRRTEVGHFGGVTAHWRVDRRLSAHRRQRSRARIWYHWKCNFSCPSVATLKVVDHWSGGLLVGRLVRRRLVCSSVGMSTIAAWHNATPTH